MPTRRIKEEYRLPAIPVAGCPVRRAAAEHGPRPQTPSATNSGSCRLNGRKADSAPMQLTPSTPTVQYPPILCAEDPIASIRYPQPLSPYVPRANLLTWLPQLLTTIADCFFWGTLPSLVEDPHQLLPRPCALLRTHLAGRYRSNASAECALRRRSNTQRQVRSLQDWIGWPCSQRFSAP